MPELVCRRCVVGSSVPDVVFAPDGVCSHCRMHDELERRYPLGPEGERRLGALAEGIKRRGRGRSYDCVVGLSGGRDTSYCLYLAKKLGLRPLAVHFDNGWDSEIAKANIARLCGGLGVDLETVIADWEESRELTNATIRAGLPYIDLTDDLGIAAALYGAAARESVRTVLLSHSFRTEGINPLKWNYVDPLFSAHVIGRFCRVKPRRFRNVTIGRLLYWLAVKRIRVVNITNYYDDRGPWIEELLARELGWRDTGGHHFDNEIFGLQSHWARRKFGVDFRVIEFAALVRSGAMTRQEALERLRTPPAHENEEVLDYCLRKQKLSRQEYERLLAEPPRYFTDYPNLLSGLRLLRKPVEWLCRRDILPGQAYEKYFCS